jgi:hypothetical protein
MPLRVRDGELAQKDVENEGRSGYVYEKNEKVTKCLVNYRFFTRKDKQFTITGKNPAGVLPTMHSLRHKSGQIGV